MSDPPLSDIDFRNKMDWIWTTLIKSEIKLRKKIQDINKGSCGLLEEALEDASGATINQEADGSCEVYEECCLKQCHPNELGTEEC